MKSISYKNYQESDFASFIEMSRKLWEDVENDELTQLLKQTTESEKYYIKMAMNSAEENVGFSIFSIRTDYVEGAKQSPTGYLEGIFVEEEYRNIGIAREFLRMGEIWCKERGCIQIGSDTWLNDQESRNFHKKVGFWEEEEVVHFLKEIK